MHRSFFKSAAIIQPAQNVLDVPDTDTLSPVRDKQGGMVIRPFAQLFHQFSSEFLRGRNRTFFVSFPPDLDRSRPLPYVQIVPVQAHELRYTQPCINQLVNHSDAHFPTFFPIAIQFPVHLFDFPFDFGDVDVVD